MNPQLYKRVNQYSSLELRLSFLHINVCNLSKRRGHITILCDKDRELNVNLVENISLISIILINT